MIVKPQTAPLASKVRGAIRSAHQISELLELGQAERPLARHFDETAQRLDAEEHTANLIVLDAECGEAARAWLLGCGARVVNAVNFRLHGPAERRSSAVSVIQFPMPSRVLAEPALAAAFYQHSNLCLVAGHSDVSLDPRAESSLAELLEAMDAVWPIVVVRNPEAVACNWLSMLRLPGLKPVVIGTDGAALTTPSAPPGLRDDLLLCRESRLLKLGGAMVAERHMEQGRCLVTRRAGIARRLRTLDEASKQCGELRVELEKVRSFFHDEISELAKLLNERARKELLPNSRLHSLIRDQVEMLEPVDLSEETGASSVRVSVDPEFSRRVTHAIRRELRQLVHADVKWVTARLEELRESLKERLKQLVAHPFHDQIRHLDEKAVWQPVDDLISVEIRYRGELPKRGFFQRLMEGRRVAFMVLIFFSLFGGAFSIRSTWFFPVLMGALFTGGMASTYISWKKQDGDRIRRELERVKDGLSGEIKRILKEAQQEKMSRIQSHLSGLQRQVIRKIDYLAREAERVRSESLEWERSELRDRIRVMDQRVVQLQTFGRQVSELQGTLDDLVHDSTQALRAALSGATGGRS